MSTDKDWKKWGKDEPYFGVFSNKKYRNENLTSEVLNEFFKSGEDHVCNLIELIQNNLGEELKLNSVLDFGCGVGRLAIPFSKISSNTIGIDISDHMIRIAEQNTFDRNIKNLNFFLSVKKLDFIKNKFSLVHSYIVFQHIPPKRGYEIIFDLADKVDKNGVLAVHILTSINANKFKRFLVTLQNTTPTMVVEFSKETPFFRATYATSCL